MKSYLNKRHLLDSSLLTCAEPDSCHVIFSNHLYSCCRSQGSSVNFIKRELLFKKSVRNEMYCIYIQCPCNCSHSQSIGSDGKCASLILHLRYKANVANAGLNSADKKMLVSLANK